MVSALRTLASAGIGERVRVRRVQDEDAERLRYLAELGIRPGATVRILDRAPYDGPITLWVGETSGTTRGIGVGLAAEVFIESVGSE